MLYEVITVRQQKLGQDGEEERQHRAARSSGGKANRRGACFDGGDEAADRTGDHHPLDPEVEDAGSYNFV